jgi:M6 family metalloprotease-like protein
VRTSIAFGLALASLVVISPRFAAAQEREGGFHPRWEIPGLDFSRDGGWRVKARAVAAERARLRAQGDFRALNAAMAAGPGGPGLATMVTGTIYVPMVLFYYQDTPAAAIRDTSQYSALLFSTTPPLGRPYTLRTFYDQLSNSQLTMLGQSIGWAVLDSNEVRYTGQPGTCSGSPSGGTNCNGLFSSNARVRMQTGLREALAKVDTGASGVNFGLFDNDGPDGNPNSGDDDGWVDMLGFAHATGDGACGSQLPNNNHIWAHRWVLLNSTLDGLQDYVTNDLSQEGGTIRIRDYFIQSALGGSASCDTTQIMPIGTAAHEFGHALGLPDLYDTGGSTEGSGRWGLMGSGNYSAPDSPARMEAWSLSELGWVGVVPLTTSGTYSFGAAPTADTTFLVRPTGSNPRGEYYLLENRQAVLADTGLIQDACVVWHQNQNPPPCAGGLLIWHVDSTQVTNGWAFNQVNVGAVGSIHGLKVEEADGGRDLWCPTGRAAPATECNRGDAGDVYPGQSGNVAFTSGTNPAATKNVDTSYAGFGIDQITQVVPGGRMSFRLTFDTNPALAIQTAGPARPAGVMGTGYADTLRATGGAGTYTWSLAGGGLPSGVTLAPTGVVSGVPGANGTFNYTARVSSGGQIQNRSYTITVTTPALTLANVLARLFDPVATTLTADQIRYLDLNGNNNGQLDVGDLKAWRESP